MNCLNICHNHRLCKACDAEFSQTTKYIPLIPPLIYIINCFFRFAMVNTYYYAKTHNHVTINTEKESTMPRLTVIILA